jgi:hypothetical protein
VVYLLTSIYRLLAWLGGAASDVDLPFQEGETVTVGDTRVKALSGLLGPTRNCGRLLAGLLVPRYHSVFRASQIRAGERYASVACVGGVE